MDLVLHIQLYAFVLNMDVGCICNNPHPHHHNHLAHPVVNKYRFTTIWGRWCLLLVFEYCTLLFKSNGIFFSNTKNLIRALCLSTWKIISINTKCFGIYIPDLITFRNRATAQWLPKVGHVRKTRCQPEMQVSHTKKIPVSATTH